MQRNYFYVREEMLRSSRKFVENYLLFLFITNQICALPQGSMGWRNLSKKVKKNSPAHAQQVYQKPPQRSQRSWILYRITDFGSILMILE
jgi:hypothetical protein